MHSAVTRTNGRPNPAGTGDPSRNSDECDHTFVHAVVDAAGEGDVIKVAAGTYTVCWPQTLIRSLAWRIVAGKNGITFSILRPKRTARGMVSKSAPALQAGRLTERVAILRHIGRDHPHGKRPTESMSTSIPMRQLM